jgi:tRNA dimethylallyltransferase
MAKIFCVFVIGPTAVGKTRLGVDLALALDGEVIGADSVQVFRGLDIGSAKPTAAEMRGVPHHMIDVADPAAGDDWSVAAFAEAAQDAIAGVAAAGKVPVVVGGSGLYVNALIYDMDFSGAGRDEDFRREVTEIPSKYSPEQLYAILKTEDPEAAATIHPHNTKRVVRAIERARIEREHGGVRPFSESFKPSKLLTPTIIRLTMEREMLYARIDRRAEEFVKAGLVGEVRGLLEAGVPPGAPAMQAIGYKEIAAHLAGEYGLDRAVELIQRNSRRYAKRQETWFRRVPAHLTMDVTPPVEWEALLQRAISEISVQAIEAAER